MSRLSMRVFAVLGLAVAVGLALALSPYASSSPDGLNRVAADTGFGDQAELHSIQDDSPIAGYAFPGIDNDRLARGVAGLVGTLGVFAIGWVIALALRRRPTSAQPWPGERAL